MRPSDVAFIYPVYICIAVKKLLFDCSDAKSFIIDTEVNSI